LIPRDELVFERKVEFHLYNTSIRTELTQSFLSLPAIR
jgi:hypothetical protein